MCLNAIAITASLETPSHKACHDSSDWVGYTESWVSDAWEVVDEESAARSARSNSADSHKAAYVGFGSASDRMDG